MAQTEADALNELRQLFPSYQWRIEATDKHVRLRRGEHAVTIRKTLDDAMAVARWFHKWLRGEPCEVPTAGQLTRKDLIG